MGVLFDQNGGGMGMQWKESYRIGNADVDAQHQGIFALAEVFFKAHGQAEKVACAMRLYQYTREHFAYEEKLMRAMAYPAFAAHVQQHDDLIEQLNGIAQRIRDGNLSANELESFLTDWLLGHIRIYDTKLAAYVAAAGP